MALGPLLLGLVLCVGAFVGSMAPVGAFSRTRDPRFLLVAGAQLALLAVGTIAVYGASAARAPGFASVPELPLALLAAAAVLLALPGLWPRGR